MSTTRPLHRRDYRVLHELSKRVEPYRRHNLYDEFCDGLDQRRGFSIWHDGNLVGMVTYSNYIPGVTVVIHFLQDPEQRGSVTRSTVREAFRYPFEDLKVPVLTSYSIPGVTDKAGEYLERLGFVREGRRREILRLPDGPRDEVIYGMLRRECRWL